MATSSPPSPSTGNLLERILLNVHGDRCIPKESGVHFTVGRASDFRGILLVFKVDDDDVAGTEIRPDWLVVCATEDCLRLTLIEMKGREGKNTKHGVEQLETFWRRLKQACDAVLPSRLRGRGRFEIQGILLTPPNSDVPRERIAALSRQGFEIQHVGAARRVDLGPLVTAPINRRLHFRPPLGLPFELTALERTFATPIRNPRACGVTRRAALVSTDERVVVSYSQPDRNKRGAHIALLVSRQEAMLHVSPGDDAATLAARLADELLSQALPTRTAPCNGP